MSPRSRGTLNSVLQHLVTRPSLLAPRARLCIGINTVRIAKLIKKNLHFTGIGSRKSKNLQTLWHFIHKSKFYSGESFSQCYHHQKGCFKCRSPFQHSSDWLVSILPVNNTLKTDWAQLKGLKGEKARSGKTKRSNKLLHTVGHRSCERGK